jgi:hypothetical protein
MSAAAAPVLLRVHCDSCRGEVELACEGFVGIVRYETYNAYFCPHCRKQNHARTAGAIVSVRAGLAATGR